jgi:enamine deaminase RidA (YjgF/YER057c/UK114 family)
MTEPNATMRRDEVNPWPWSLQFAFNQAELLERPERLLVCSGQISVDADGTPQHAGDMGAQIALALDNLETVLAGAGMGLANVVGVTIYTTDVDELFANYAVLAERLETVGVRPASTLLGITRLAFPGLLVEIQAVAAQ